MKYYMLCTQCGKRSPITEEEARIYALMRMAAGGRAAACAECGGAVKGEITDDQDRPMSIEEIQKIDQGQHK